jgi:hypothetical protein
MPEQRREKRGKKGEPWILVVEERNSIGKVDKDKLGKKQAD